MVCSLGGSSCREAFRSKLDQGGVRSNSSPRCDASLQFMGNKLLFRRSAAITGIEMRSSAHQSRLQTRRPPSTQPSPSNNAHAQAATRSLNCNAPSTCIAVPARRHPSIPPLLHLYEHAIQNGGLPAGPLQPSAPIPLISTQYMHLVRQGALHPEGCPPPTSSLGWDDFAGGTRD